MCVKLFLFVLTFYFIYVQGAPRLSGSEINVTVVIGRDATFTCNVENLQNYKVAWMRVDTQTILTIGQHVITKNHRVGVTRGEPHAWTLTLRDVRPSDSGLYMCQINTEPMTSQSYKLHVHEPPDILDSDSSGEVVVQEGDSIALHCAASGIPKPIVTWRREDLNLLVVNDEKVAKWEGVWLNVTSAHRDMNGALFCIASNGVPPSVSKRILLHVLCIPNTEVIRKITGVYMGEDAALQCRIKAYPSPKIYWTDMYKNRLIDGAKYETKTILNVYEHTSTLKINNVSRDDVGSYQCHAENTLGHGKDSVTLYTLATTTAFSTSTGQIVTSSDPRTTASADYANQPSFPTKTGFADSDTFAVVLSQHQMQNEGTWHTYAQSKCQYRGKNNDEMKCCWDCCREAACKSGYRDNVVTRTESGPLGGTVHGC